MRKSIHSESEMVKAVKELESGVNAEVVAREHGISKATLYQWKSKYSGMDVSQVRRLKELEEENREGRETMPLVVSELEDGLRVPLNEPKTYLGEGAYPITDATFRNNALLFEGGQVAVVDLLDKHGAPVLRVDCPQAEAFGIWAPFKPGCPFVCLEPWCGICDPSDFHGTLPERKYIHRLRAGEEFGFEYGITV